MAGTNSAVDALVLNCLILSHPERTQDYLIEVAGADARETAISMSSAGQSRLHVNDLFPSPGRRNRLPNYEERYHGLLEGVEFMNLDAQTTRELTLQINQEFMEVVPDAHAAVQRRR